jgi:hypothetical protein
VLASDDGARRLQTAMVARTTPCSCRLLAHNDKGGRARRRAFPDPAIEVRQHRGHASVRRLRRDAGRRRPLRRLSGHRRRQARRALARDTGGGLRTADDQGVRGQASQRRRRLGRPVRRGCGEAHRPRRRRPDQHTGGTLLRAARAGPQGGSSASPGLGDARAFHAGGRRRPGRSGH